MTRHYHKYCPDCGEETPHVKCSGCGKDMCSNATFMNVDLSKPVYCTDCWNPLKNTKEEIVFDPQKPKRRKAGEGRKKDM